jgi:sorting nexin-1/2
VLDARQEFEQCSRLIKSEVARFEQERIEDFKLSLQSFLDGMISGQKQASFISTHVARITITDLRQLIAAWESYQQMLLQRTRPKRSSVSSSNEVEA